MVHTLIDHRSDVTKCSIFKSNHEPQASGVTAKFWTFYGIISTVYKSVDHGKLWSILLFTITFFFTKNQTTKQPALRDMLRHFHRLYSHRPKLSTNQRARIRSVIVKFAIVHRLDNKVRESFVFENRFFKLYPRSSRQHAVLSSIYWYHRLR